MTNKLQGPVPYRDSWPYRRRFADVGGLSVTDLSSEITAMLECITHDQPAWRAALEAVVEARLREAAAEIEFDGAGDLEVVMPLEDGWSLQDRLEGAQYGLRWAIDDLNQIERALYIKNLRLTELLDEYLRWPTTALPRPEPQNPPELEPYVIAATPEDILRIAEGDYVPSEQHVRDAIEQAWHECIDVVKRAQVAQLMQRGYDEDGNGCEVRVTLIFAPTRGTTIAVGSGFLDENVHT